MQIVQANSLLPKTTFSCLGSNPSQSSSLGEWNPVILGGVRIQSHYPTHQRTQHVKNCASSLVIHFDQLQVWSPNFDLQTGLETAGETVKLLQQQETRWEMDSCFVSLCLCIVMFIYIHSSLIFRPFFTTSCTICSLQQSFSLDQHTSTFC